MQNTFTYKGFTFDFLFQFVKQIGQNLIYGFPGNATSPGSFFRGTSNQPLTIVNRWQNSGDEAQIQKVGTQFSNPQVSYAFASDAAFSDASYIRLKNASISWNFPKEWCEKIHLQNFRLYAQGQNLLTITHYKGLDPENQGYFYLPPLMVVIVGGQINF
jgi:hypothetical protein